MEIDVKILKTNIDWLNTLLLNETANVFLSEETNTSASQNKQTLLALLEKDYAERVKDAKEERFTAKTILRTQYHGQLENIATFSMTLYESSGEGHNLFSTRFFNVDLSKKALINLDNVIDNKHQEKLKELLWEAYSREFHDENFEPVEPSTPKEKFYIAPNFYFAPNGINFVYPPNALGSYVKGEKTLTLDWNDVGNLLMPEFAARKLYLMD